MLCSDAIQPADAGALNQGLTTGLFKVCSGKLYYNADITPIVAAVRVVLPELQVSVQIECTQ